MHFFNPPALMKLVEVVAAERVLRGGAGGCDRGRRAMGRTPIRARDTPGFVANRLARPFSLESLRMLGDGVADARDDRPRRPPRRRLPDGPVRADRPDRPRRQPRHRPLLLRPGRRARALAPEPDPGTAGRRRQARPQERPGYYTYGEGAAARARPRARASTAPTLDPESWRRSTPPRRRSSPASSPRSPTRPPSRSKKRSPRPRTWTRRCGSASTGRSARSAHRADRPARARSSCSKSCRASAARPTAPPRLLAAAASERERAEPAAGDRAAQPRGARLAAARRRARTTTPTRPRRPLRAGRVEGDGRHGLGPRVLRLPRRGVPPDTANPSLWRQAGSTGSPACSRSRRLLPAARLRPLEHARRRGRRGIVVIDPLISAETAAAALALYREHRGERPVTGADLHPQPHRPLRRRQGHRLRRGGRPGADPVLAPAGFLHHAVSENVYAGTAMGRRAGYMYGAMLRARPRRAGRLRPRADDLARHGDADPAQPRDHRDRPGGDGRRRADGLPADARAPRRRRR